MDSQTPPSPPPALEAPDTPVESAAPAALTTSPTETDVTNQQTTQEDSQTNINPSSQENNTPNTHTLPEKVSSPPTVTAALSDTTPENSATTSTPPTVTDTPPTSSSTTTPHVVSTPLDKNKPATSNPIALFIQKLAPQPESGKIDRIRLKLVGGEDCPEESEFEKDEYDTEAWSALLAEALSRNDQELAREAFELFLKQFPTSARHWIQYAELELRAEELERVEAIFARCLRSVLSVDLWRFYLAYIRRINSDDKGKPTTLAARSVISKAYEFVLQYVGVDKDSGPIWADYLFFLKSAEVTGTWEEQQKMDAMRKSYHRAVGTPLGNVEHLWREYDSFEISLNRMTAKKFLAEKSPSYMTARAAIRELRSICDGLNRTALAKPPTWSPKEIHQLEQWKKYIAWEKSNPLHLEEGSPALAARVIYAHKQALMVLRFHPEIWYDAANYWIELGKTDDAANILKMGTEVMPTSFLLAFAYAELEEGRKQNDKARTAYENLVTAVTDRYDKIRIEQERRLEVMESRFHAELEQEKEMLISTSNSSSTTAAPQNNAPPTAKNNKLTEGEIRERLRQRQRDFESRKAKTRQRNAQALKTAGQGVSLAWIMYIRFARRSEGVKKGREVFLRARKSPGCGWEVFVASALMEYYNSKDEVVAGRVFELGLKSFAQEPDYVTQYLEHLIHLNDDGNTRALFERALQTMSPEKSRPIWQLFYEYENKYGDMAAAQKVEKRRTEAEPDVPAIRRCIDRYSYLDINMVQKEIGPIAEPDGHSPPPGDQRESDHHAEATERPSNNIQAGNQNSHRGPALLDSVHPERYPRPDFSRWVPYKPTPPARPTPAQGGTGGDRAPQEGRAPMGGRGEGLGGPGAPVGVGSASQPPPVPSVVPLSWGKLPEAVAYFLGQVPPASMFGPPLLNPDDVISILRSAVLTPPHPPQQQQQQHPLPPRPPAIELERRAPPHGRSPPPQIPVPIREREWENQHQQQQHHEHHHRPNLSMDRDWDRRPIHPIPPPPPRDGGVGIRMGPVTILGMPNMGERGRTPPMGMMHHHPHHVHHHRPNEGLVPSPGRRGVTPPAPPQIMRGDRRAAGLGTSPPPRDMRDRRPSLGHGFVPGGIPPRRDEREWMDPRERGAQLPPPPNSMGPGSGIKRKPTLTYDDDRGMPPVGMGIHGIPPLRGPPVDDAMYRGGRPVKRYRDDSMPQ